MGGVEFGGNYVNHRSIYGSNLGTFAIFPIQLLLQFCALTKNKL